MQTCKSCGGTYEPVQRNGAAYFHACSPEVITPATFDKNGVELTAEVRTPRANPRDENIDDSPAAVQGARGAGNPNAPLPLKRAGAGVQ